MSYTGINPSELREHAAHLKELENCLQDLQKKIDEEVQLTYLVYQKESVDTILAKYNEAKASEQWINQMLLKLSDNYEEIAKQYENFEIVDPGQINPRCL